MWMYFMLLGAMGGLFLVSGRVKIPEERKISGWKIPFYKSACFLTGIRKGKESDEKTIQSLADVLLILFLGLGVTLLVESILGTQMINNAYVENANQTVLERPKTGEGNLEMQMQVQIEGMEETADLEVIVGERQYTETEKIQFLKDAMEQLDTVILGENVSADEVRGQIVLPTEMLNGIVAVQWSKDVDPPEAVDDLGNISPDLPAEGMLLNVRGTLVCQDREAVYERTLRLLPPIRSPQEQLLYGLQKEVEAVNVNTAEDECMVLPEQIEGKNVKWQKRKSSVMDSCMMLTLLAAAAVWFGKGQEYKKQEEQRKRQMIMDYPGLLFQLSMLLEAGLTMQNAFGKIALDYRERREQRPRFAYEEMLVSCYEMQSGVSEREAYEHFGNRCGENCYVRLGATLSGNLQKGAQGLSELLRQEAITAMEERRQLAKKLGEEAGTKLLLPMILMLLVVLVILMVPAMMAF